jgi:predicted RNase H-like HicB family nuclease
MDPVRVIYHHDAECWWAESPDIPGWTVAGDGYEEARGLVIEGVPFALGHDAEIEHYLPAPA